MTSTKDVDTDIKNAIETVQDIFDADFPDASVIIAIHYQGISHAYIAGKTNDLAHSTLMISKLMNDQLNEH